MQLPHASVRQTYLNKVKLLESKLNEATSGEIDKAQLTAIQKQLDALAEKYQFSDEIGDAGYKLYELQALVHYFEGNDDEALDFINQAIEVRGGSYSRAEKLKQNLQSDNSLSEQVASRVAPSTSEAERNIISTKQAVDRASFWSFAVGIIYIIFVLLFLTIDQSVTFYSVAILLVSFCFIYIGWNLNKVKGDDTFIRKMLVINIVISAITILTIFPIFILVSSIIALLNVRKFEGRFHKDVKQYSKILQRTYEYQNKRSIFFDRSPIAIIILNVATLGFYRLYWVYKHWAFIKKSTGESVYPVLSSIFQVFTIYPLMKRIKHGAQHHGYNKFTNAGWAAAGFIILLFLSNGLGRAEIDAESTGPYIVFGLLFELCAGLIMSVVQRAANAHNLAMLGEKHEYKKVFAGEIVMVIIGVIIGLFALASIVFTIIAANEDNTDYISPEVTAAYNRMELLRSQYNSCNGDLEARRDNVDIYNDSEVNDYNNDLEICENTRLELNLTVDEYNRLAGFE